MNKCAVIDIGSNSVRMSVYSFENNKPEVIKNIRKYVRLSDGMEKDNLLKEEAMTRTINALTDVNKMAIASGAEYVCCIATEAVRRAGNADIFLKLARKMAGVDIKVLSGDEEPRYGFIAVSRNTSYDNTVIIDVGGGSAEITFVKDKKLIKSGSLQLGSVILTERFSDKTQEELYNYVYEQIKSIEFLKDAKFFAITALGGIPHPQFRGFLRK